MLDPYCRTVVPVTLPDGVQVHFINPFERLAVGTGEGDHCKRRSISLDFATRVIWERSTPCRLFDDDDMRQRVQHCLRSPVVAAPQTVAPNVAKAAGRSNPNAAVLGSLACLVDIPEWGGAPRPASRRLPAGDVMLQVDVPSFTDQAGLPSNASLFQSQNLDCVGQTGASFPA